MKAQAKKILALIMAMVMCLSLAVPAFAATITDNGDEGKGAYKIATGTDTNYTIFGNVTDEKQPSGVTVTRKIGGYIGESKNVTYTVSYANGSDATSTDITVNNGGGTKELVDVADSDWKALEQGQTVKLVESGKAKFYQVSGSVYQEPHGNGAYKPYFKLNKVDGKGGFKADDSVYFVGELGAELKSTSDMGAALAKAKKCDVKGVPGAPIAYSEKDPDLVLLTTETENPSTTVWSMSTMNASEGLAVDPTVAATSDLNVNFKKGTEETTGSFQVSIKATTTKDGKNTDAYVTNVDEAKAKLTERWATGNNAKLESVEAASGNYVKVNVSNIATADEFATESDLYSKNVTYYNNDGKNEAVLIDLSKDGWYNGTTDKGANATTVAANTEALGPVVVKASDVSDTNKYTVTGNNATLSDTNWLVFSSVAKMKKGIKAQNCTAGKSINYVQVKLNPWNGTKQNKLVNEVKKSTDDKAAAQSEATKVVLTGAWKSDAWNTSNADFVVKGSFEIEAASHGTTIKTTEVTTAATCKKPGVKIVRTVCQDCNNIIDTKTEEIPVLTDPVETNTQATVTDPNGETVAKLWFDDSDTTDKSNHKTNHYLNKAETTTTTSEDKSETIVTTVFTCNHGEVHDNYTRTVIVKKGELQNSGRWNFITWDGRNEEQVLTGSNADDFGNLFGYTDGITIADSDVELEGLPLNRKSGSINKQTNKTTVFDANSLPAATTNNGDDLVIHFADTALASGTKNPDGSVYTTQTARLDNVYATANGIPTTKYYVAKLTAKKTKEALYACQTGAATMTVDVYEVAKDANGWNTAKTNAENCIGEAYLEKNLSKGKVKLLHTYTKEVTIRAQTYHNWDDKTGICKTCLQGVQAVDDVMFTADTIVVNDLKWTGKKAQPKVVVVDTKGNTLLKGIDYAVEEIEDTDAGDYTITIKGLGDYAGNRVTVPFKINKVAGTLKKKSAPSKLTASATKKVTGQIKMTVKGGKVSAYKVTGKVAGVSVNKSGKITVKKGNKKAGTLKVKVSMKADKNHTAAKAVTVKVAIKAAPAAKKTTKKK